MSNAALALRDRGCVQWTVAKKVPAEVREFFNTTQPEAVREYFVKMGRKGGKIGGKKSAANQHAGTAKRKRP